jgi:hypothetical protein
VETRFVSGVRFGVKSQIAKCGSLTPLDFIKFRIFKTKNKTKVCDATLLVFSFQVLEPTPHLIIMIDLLLAEP